MIDLPRLPRADSKPLVYLRETVVGGSRSVPATAWCCPPGQVIGVGFRPCRTFRASQPCSGSHTFHVNAHPSSENSIAVPKTLRRASLNEKPRRISRPISIHTSEVRRANAERGKTSSLRLRRDLAEPKQPYVFFVSE